MRGAGEDSGASARGGSGVWPRRGGRPLLRGPSAPPAAAEVGASRAAGLPPARPRSVAPHLASPSSVQPSVSRRGRHLSRSPGLSPSGVSVALIVSAAFLSSPDWRPPLTGSPALAPSPELCLGLCPSRSPPPKPPPASPSPSLRLSLSRQLPVSLLVPAPLGLLRVPVSPGLFQLPRRAPGLGHPSPCQVTMRSPGAPKAPRLLRGSGVSPGSFPRRPLGSPGTPPPTPGCRASTASITLRKRGGGRNRKANFGAGGGPGNNLPAPAAARSRHAP